MVGWLWSVVGYFSVQFGSVQHSAVQFRFTQAFEFVTWLAIEHGD